LIIDLAASETVPWVFFAVPVSIGPGHSEKTLPFPELMNFEEPWELMRYDAKNERYLTYGTDAEFGETFQPGAGYILRSDHPEQLVVRCPMVDENRDFSVNLVSGWNLVGYPFTQGVTAAKCRLADDTQTLAFDAAASNLWIQRYIWGMKNGDLVFEAVDDLEYGRFEPFGAYWIRAHRDCVLTFPAPGIPEE
jgi:hypothetical protein